MSAAGRIRICAPPAGLAGDAPDAHLVLEGGRGDALARCSLWWRSGAIGHFSARDGESGARLLGAACARLAERGCRLAVGPMDGNTWRRYRLVIERGDEPPFFLEPDNPEHWMDSFAQAGFSVLARYCSSVQEQLCVHDERLRAVGRRAAEAGIRIRTFNREDAERDLRGLYALALESFRSGFLFSAIGWTQFREQYARLLPMVREELLLIAEQLGKPVAFLFALPDALEPLRGAAPRTVILKTVATRPGRAYAGLAHLLAERAAAAAAGLGYTRAVHALMHEANSSHNWSTRHGRVFRRYALMGRPLDAS